MTKIYEAGERIMPLADLLANNRRAELGVDGNAGFALIGNDLQDGEAEFVTIECDEPRWTAAWEVAACRAATTAFERLKTRLGQNFSYYLGPSHPRHC